MEEKNNVFFIYFIELKTKKFKNYLRQMLFSFDIILCVLLFVHFCTYKNIIPQMFL